MLGKFLIILGQFGFLLLLAPLLNGFIKKTKAFTQCRRGPSMLQPYFDILKFLRRESVVSVHTSWITQLTPLICLSTYLVAGSLIPLWEHQSLGIGDIIALTYLFALARFFLALAALEPASAFGGMGSSREMMIASLVEPVMVVGLFGLAAVAGTTELSELRGAGQSPTGLLVLLGLLIVTLAETGRIPVDNPDTHLELTMVHEAMLLEYSGRQLGLLHLAAMIKQAVLLLLLIHLFWPLSPVMPIFGALGILVMKVLVLGLVLALVESVLAKQRLFKLPDLMAGGMAFCLLAILSNYLV